MPSFYGNRDGSITNQDILKSYMVAYESLHKQKPANCMILENNQFKICGVVHERRWVLLEIERLRQEALSQHLHANTTTFTARKLRRLSDI